MKTEEGRLKDQVKRYLNQLGAHFHMPVPSGYGRQTIDFLCCVPIYHNGGRIGMFVGIETKAPGGKPTPRQKQCIEEIKAAGGVAFYCDTYEGFLLTMASYGLTPAPKP